MTVDAYPPDPEAAFARIAAVRPAAYARTRNALDGAVSGLSPYITHGFVSLRDVLAGVAERHPLDVQHKFVFELGWRAYFRHVWSHRGDGILRSLHDGPLPDDAYAGSLPPDIRSGTTGLPVVDQAVRTLYATGLLHNHARMWLASYCVHLRKVHWRAAADWMVGHLLDGDLASNHLSWQWVAGTASHKPYLFNAENVARYAPPPWHSPGTVLDTSYEALDRLARRSSPVPSRPGVAAASPAVEPPLLPQPPASAGFRTADAADVRGAEVWLVHPWNLGALPQLPPGTRVVALAVADWHASWPWSPARWGFVGTRMAALTDLRWFDSAERIGAALAEARQVRTVADPHLQRWLLRWAACTPEPALFPDVATRCGSFSQWWHQATRGVRSVDALLGR
jgi:deoxyribodipyrimidine photo-lyase